MPNKDIDLRRKYQREWVARRRNEFFKDKVCLHCGTSNELELHHLDPSVKESHNIWSWSEKRRLLEISKCVVLCSKCHWKETEKQRGYNIFTHGTTTCYANMPCRCRLCKDAKMYEKREWRAKKKLESIREVAQK